MKKAGSGPKWGARSWSRGRRALAWEMGRERGCEVPRAAVTNDRKSVSLKQKQPVLSQIRRAEVRKRDVCRAVSPPEALGENPSLPLPASGAPGISWLVAAELQSLLLSLGGLPLFSLCVSFIKTVVIGFRAYS